MSLHSNDLMDFWLIAGVGLVVLVAIVGVLLNAHRERAMTHAERMKALEMGREEPEIAKIRAEAAPAEAPTYAGRCYSATGRACFWGFLFAIGAANRDGGHSPAVAIAIAASAGAVGVAGLICGTVLATRAPAAGPPTAKPRHDPDIA